MTDRINEENKISPILLILPVVALFLVIAAIAVLFSAEPSERVLQQLPPRWLQEQWIAENSTATLTAAQVKDLSVEDIVIAEENDKLVYRLPIDHPKPDPYKDLRGPNDGTLIPGSATASDHPGAWRQFRGDNHDGMYTGREVRLAREWPDVGPAVLWEIEVGEGHAGAAIDQGRVYVVDYDREKSEDAIRCLSLDSGKEIWRYTYSVEIKRNHGMSRTIPAVGNGYVVSFGPKCHIKCLDAETGELNWERQLVMDNNAKVPLWYAGQCPLIDGKNVILAPGADPLMMAIDVETGAVVWEANDDVITGQTHSSIIPMEIEGVYQYVYEAETGVVSVEAETGQVLWTHPGWKIKIANAASPVYVGDGRVFCTGGYGAGSVMLQIEKDENGQFSANELFRLPPSVFGSEQHTPVFYDGHLYGVEPRPKAEMICLDVDGNRVWASGGEHRFEIGPYMIVDGLMLALHGQTCELTLAEISPDGFNELAKAKVLEGHDAWGPMAYAEGRLIVRDLTKMICLDIGD